MTDNMNLYIATDAPGCAWGLVLLRTKAEYLMLTHRGLRSVSAKTVAVIRPDDPEYERADEVWQAAFSALRLASLVMPATATPTTPTPATMTAMSTTSGTKRAPQTREQRLGAMRRALRSGSQTLRGLAEAMGVSRSYARSLFAVLVEAGEGQHIGEQCALVPAAKRNIEASLKRVRGALHDGPRTFTELARMTGLSPTYSRKLALQLLETGEAQQVDGRIKLVA